MGNVAVLYQANSGFALVLFPQMGGTKEIARAIRDAAASRPVFIGAGGGS